MTTTLSDKLTSAEQFDATPAGKALKEFRRALMAAAADDGSEDGPRFNETGGLWTKCRSAERALIEEIKRLQSNALRKRPIAWMRQGEGYCDVQFQGDARDPPEDEGWIALYRRGGP